MEEKMRRDPPIFYDHKIETMLRDDLDVVTTYKTQMAG